MGFDESLENCVRLCCVCNV